MNTTGALAPGGHAARVLALGSLAVLVAAAVLFGGVWAAFGEDAVSDNWVGLTVVLGLFVGLFGSLAAMLGALVAGLRHGEWAQLWLPLVTFPGVVAVVALMELFVFE